MRALSEDAGKLNHTDASLFDSTTLIQKDHEQIKQLSESLKVNQFHLSSMTNNLTELVTHIKAQADMTTVFNDETRTRLNHSMTITQATTANTESVVSHANRTIEDAMKQLNDYKTEQAKIESTPSQTNQSNNTKSILKYVEKLLAEENKSSGSRFISTYGPLM